MCHMDLLFTEVKCTPSQEDRRTFQVELALQAQAVLRREVMADVLEDLYSTDYQLQTEEETLSLCRLLGQGEEQETFRETVETGGAPGNLLDLQLRLGRTSQSQEGEDRVLTQEVEAVVLYETPEGVAAAHHRGAVQHRLPGQGEGLCRFTAELLREPTATAQGESVEVSAPLSFRWMTLAQEETPVLSRILLGEKREAAERQPSVTLRAVRPGEDLWSVAKAYLTTDREILEASGLASEELCPGQMLLIPRKSS